MITWIEDLRGFQVHATTAEAGSYKLTGVFTRVAGVRLGPGWLYVDNERSLAGDLVELDETTGRAAFLAPFWTPESAIQAGSIAPWIDGYWQAYHVTMILNRDAGWRRIHFQPTDAQHFVNEGVHGWSQAGTVLPAGAVPTFIETGGWDHEHCELCSASIGPRSAPYGYLDQEDHWLCEECYESYAATGSLEFLGLQADGTPG